MKTNVSINLTDDQRRVIHENFYGGKKGLISRKDVTTICQTAITDWLMGRNNGPQIGEKIADAMKESISFDEQQYQDGLRRDELCNMGDGELKEALIESEKQNKLLLNRVNVLQHALDTKRK